MYYITKTLNVGGFVVNLNERDAVKIPADVKVALERIANQYPTNSNIVRFDMAPWDGEGVPPVYEVETSPGGLMFSFPEFPWKQLASIADVAICLPKHEEWMPAYQQLSSLTGWPIVREWVPNKRIYFSGEASDVPDWVRPITDPTSSKKHIVAVTGGEVIGPKTSLNFGDLTKKYPKGFVVKPEWGWGSKHIYMYPINNPMYSVYARSKSEIKDLIKKATISEEKWLIQPFFGPEPVDFGSKFLIWRIYAIRESNGKFQLIGGTWNCRPKIKVHGASDNVVGRVYV